MKYTRTRISTLKTRINDGIMLLTIRAPSPNTMLVALIVGPAALMMYRSL